MFNFFKKKSPPKRFLEDFNDDVVEHFKDILRPFDPNDIIANDPNSNIELATILLEKNGADKVIASTIVSEYIRSHSKKTKIL